MFRFTWAHGWDWDEVLQALGLDPADIRKQAVGAHLSEDDVMRKLRQRVQGGKSLAASAVAKDDMQLANAASRRFGSYASALEAAGFDPEQVRLKLPKVTPAHIAQLRREMMRVAALHGHPRAIAAAALKKKYAHMVFNRLGNWRKACRKFGIEPANLSVYPYACKAHVLEGLRRWIPVHGASINYASRKNRSLFTAVYRFCGSWPEAVKEAGIV